MHNGVPRIVANPGSDNAYDGMVVWSKAKSSWISGVYLIAIVGGYYTFSLEALLVFILSSAVTLCAGHSLGMHRRLIHNSYVCPLWMEYVFVYMGVLVGLAGPLGMMKTHDMRDWAQRQSSCHDYFAHRQSMLLDWFWQLHCDVRLTAGPKFRLEPRVAQNKVYQFLEATWMLQQLPWVVLFWFAGGLPWVIWGVFVRIAVSVTGHWLVGYFAHTQGQRYWHVRGAAVQGYNVQYLGLITMGECWHNNHHAFPGSAKLGLYAKQADPGWWLLCALEKIGLVWDIKLPDNLPKRPELITVPVEQNSLPCYLQLLSKLRHGSN